MRLKNLMFRLTKAWIMIIFIICILSISCKFINISNDHYILELNEDFTYLKSLSLNEQSYCEIPELRLGAHNNHEKVKPCEVKVDWGYFKNQRWHLNKSALKIYSNIKCQYKVIRRIDDFKLDESNYFELKDNFLIENEFFEVHCTGFTRENTVVTYENVFAQIIRKDMPKFTAKEISNQCKPMNILMLSYDSVSRVSWLRRMIKTTEYMMNEMNFKVFEGLNILGDGTPAALIPILTGFTEEELPSALRTDPKGKFVDEVFPFIFKELHELGYVTYWNEDWPQVGTFTYRMRGVKHDLTTHYMRAYQMKVWEKVRRRYESRGDLCLGAKTRHRHNLNLLNEFFHAYKNSSSKHFAFHHYSENSHDGNSRLKLSDEDLYDFLKENYENGNFNSTAILIYSDHGDRFHNERRNPQGYLEERLPFMSMYLPKGYQADDESQLKANQKRLISPFDIYATLRHLTCLTQKNQLRAMSVLDKIPLNRSCKDIGISSHFCTCNHWTVLDSQTKLGPIAGDFIINLINYHLTDACETLHLKKVISIEILEAKKDSQIKIQFETRPNDAIYEATTEIASFNPLVLKMSSIGSISRLNKYGAQAWCVENAHSLVDLRKFCFCIKIKK